MGSKARWAKHLLPIILADREDGQLYVEPFVGGGNTFHLVDNPKWGNDVNQDVVAMLEAVGDNWWPPGIVTEQEYNLARHGPGGYLRGFIGIGCSYGGKFFGGYARGDDAKGNPRNYARESRDNLLKQYPGLADCKWSADFYWEMNIPAGSIVYCDPPYAQTTGYAERFDTPKFWDWCTELAKTCQVFVSEYEAPDPWREVWSANAISKLSRDNVKTSTERLFTL